MGCFRADHLNPQNPAPAARTGLAVAVSAKEGRLFHDQSLFFMCGLGFCRRKTVILLLLGQADSDIYFRMCVKLSVLLSFSATFATWEN